MEKEKELLPEEEYLNSFENWINDNMMDTGPPNKQKEEPTNDNSAKSEPEEIVENNKNEEITRLQKLRGDSLTEPVLGSSKITGKIIKGLIAVIVIAFTFSIFVKLYYEPVTVVGPSMYPTLEDGDILRTITKVSKDRIRYDTIICFSKGDSRLIIKRVVGLPGDTLSFKNGKVYVNGILREEDFPAMKEYPKGEIILGEDEYYCLGDNRNNSKDSRYYGPINIKDITNIVISNTTKEKEDMNKAIKEYKKVSQMTPTDATKTDSKKEGE